MAKKPPVNIGRRSGLTDDQIQTARLNAAKRNAEQAALDLPEETGGSIVGAGFLGGSQYDDNLIRGTNQEKARAIQQGGWDELGNMVGRVAYNLVPGIVGSIAGMADVPDYLAGITQQDEVGNAVTQWANDFKEKTNQERFPIYKQNPGAVLDVGSTEWWTDNGSSLLESAAEFAILGFGVGTALKGLAASKWLKALTTVTDITTGASKLKPWAEAAVLGTDAFLLNHAEGMLEATQVYGSELEKNMKLVDEGKLTEEQAKINAGAAAGHTLNINRANVLLNLTGVSSIVKGARGSRNLIRSLSSPQKIILEGGQEYLEESVNFYATNRGEEYGKTLREGKPYKTWDALDPTKFVSDVLTAKGLEAGFLGALGGVAQTGVVAGVNKIKGGEDVEKAYEAEQNAVREGYEDLRNENKLKSVRDFGVAAKTLSDLGQQRAAFESEMQKAKDEGRPVSNDLIAAWQKVNNQIQDEQLHVSFQSGTAEYTEKAYKDIESLTEEDALKHGFTGSELDPKSPAYYKHVARRMQERLTTLEKAYNKTAGYNNSLELYENRVEALRVKDQLDFFSKQESVLVTEAQEAADRLARTEKTKGLPFLGAIDITRLNEPGYEKLENVKDPDVTLYRKDLINVAKNLPEVQALAKMQETKKLAQTELDDLETKYKERTTFKYQEILRKQVEAKRAEDKAQVEADKVRAAAIKQQGEHVAAKAKEQHIKNEEAFGKTLESQGVTAEERTVLKSALDREVNTPVGQTINYTAQEEIVMAKYPEFVTKYRDVINAAVATDTNLGKPNELVYTASDEVATDEFLSNLEQTGLDMANVIPANDPGPSKLHRANNVMAWLSRAYETVTDPKTWTKKFADVDNKINDELKDPTILDARTLKIGDNVILKIDPNGIVPEVLDDNDVNTPWAEFEAKNLDSPATLANNAPIGIYRPGEATPIGYVHLPTWITAGRVEGSEEYIQAEIAKVIQIRNAVHAAGPEGVQTKITQRTLGKLFLDAAKAPAPVSTNLRDPELEYVVFYKNRLLASEKSTRDTDKDVLNRNKLRSGVTYVLIPVEKNTDPKLTKYWAIPLKINKLQENVINSIARASQVYLNSLKAEELTAEDKAIAAAIVEMQKNVKAADGSAINFDITTEEGIINYTELFIYNHTTQSTATEKDPETGEVKKAKDLDFDKYFLQKYKSLPSDYFAHKFNRKKGLQFGSGKSGVVPRANDAQFMQAWKEHLANRYQHTSLRFLQDKNVKLPIINEDNTVSELAPGNSYLNYLKEKAWTTNLIGQNVATGTQPDNWVYTIQQIIEFDTAVFGVENKITTEADREKAKKAREKAAREAKKATKEAKKGDPRIASIEAKRVEHLAAIEDYGYANEVTERFATPIHKQATLPFFEGKTRAAVEAQINDLYDKQLAAIKPAAAATELTVPAFAARLIAGETLTTPEHIQFYENNKTAIEAELVKARETEIAAATAAAAVTPSATGLATQEDIAKQNTEALKKFKGMKGIVSDEEMPNLPGLNALQTAVTGEVVVTDDQMAANVAEEAATKEALGKNLLKSETAYQDIKSKYALPKSEHFDNAALRDLLDFWTNNILDSYNEATKHDTSLKQKEKLYIQDFLDELKANFTIIKDAFPVGSKNYNTASYSLENWAVMQNLIKHNLQRDFGFNFKVYEYEQADQDENNKLKSLGDTEQEGEEGDNNVDNPDEARSLKEKFGLDSMQQDPAKGLSSRFRRFLGSLKDPTRHHLIDKKQNPNFKPVRLYRTLSALLADTDPDFNKMMRILEKMAAQPGFEYLAAVREALMNADEQIKAEFVVTMSKHYVNMKHLYIITRLKGGIEKTYEGYLRDDNYNAKVEVIKDRWEHDLYYSTIAADYTGNDLKEGRQIYDKAGIDKAVETFEKALMVDGKRPEGQETADVEVEDFAIEPWLRSMGIYLSPGALPDLKKHGTREHPNPNKNKFNYRNMFYAEDGEFWRIYKFIKSIQESKDDVFIENLPLTNDSAIYRLAHFDAKYNLDALSNSHKSGNKSIFSYADNKYLFDRARQFQDHGEDNGPDMELLQRLADSPFVGKHSQELRQILKWDKNTNDFVKGPDGKVQFDSESEYNKNFSVAYASLSVLIQKGVPVGNKNALEDLDAREHMVTKFMMFQNRGTKPDTGPRRGHLFHMTLADKDTMVLFEKPIPGIGLDVNGQINQVTIDMLYNDAVMPEINRMLAFDAAYPPNIKNYAQGQRLFYIFPKLNLINDLFNIQLGPEGQEVARSLKKDVTTNPAYKALIDEVIKSTITTEANYTMQQWEELGMLHRNNEGNVSRLDYLDPHYTGWVKKQLPARKEAIAMGEVVNYSATEMAVAYMLHDTNLFQLFTTDPATQYNYKKPNPDAAVDIMDEVYQTYDNIGKRLGGEISPGRDGYTQQTGISYTMAVMEDIEIPSKALKAYQKLFENDPKAAAAYANLTSTDGAEFITLPEKLRFMREHAKLNPTQLKALDNIEKKYDKAIAAIKAGKDPSEHNFNYDELKLIFQVDKPIMVGTRVDQNVEAKLFVKSAAFTLIPELIRDTELEKLMVFMSNKDNPIARMATSSAAKLGAPARALKLFDNNGDFDQTAVLDPSDVLVIPRKFLRLQQETPYKETTEISRGSQLSKQAFVNILDVEGFRLPGVEKPYTGRELNKIYNNHFEFLYKNSYEELVKKLGIKTDSHGKVSLDYKKLNNLIQDELVSRGYPAHDLDALEITRFPKEEVDENGKVIALPPGVEPQWRFKMPVWAAAQSGKLEAFLNSIVTTRILRQRFNGYGFVLGPEGGYKFKPSEQLVDAAGKKLKKGVLTDLSQLGKKLQDQVIFTDKFDKATGLKPALANNGFHQVILPWKFKENLKNYIVDGKFDMSAIDPDLLKVFGMRIPNQGPNSTAAIEIVGFFPPSAGDLLIAPADFTAQMGSDFDIDKLYTYMYHYKTDDNGKLTRVDAGEATDRESHQNKLLDIYLAINTNPDPTVQKLVSRPLTTEGLGDIADALDEAKKARSIAEAKAGGRISPYDLSPASGSYQSFKYQSSTVAGAAIGAFAVQNTFNALAQTVEGGLKMVKDWGVEPGAWGDEKEPGKPVKYRKITFGQEVFNGNLSKPKTKKGNYVSTNIGGMLTAVLDNIKLDIAGRIGLNLQNLSVVNFMLQAQFELDTIANFISQDILQEYTKQLAIANGNADKAFAAVMKQKQFAFEDELFKNKGVYTEKALKEALAPGKKLVEDEDEDEYTHSADTRNPVQERFWNYYNMGSEELFKYIALGEKAEGYKEAQYALLLKYRSISRKPAAELRALQGLSNIDSKGIGANIFQSLLQQGDIELLGNNTALNIENAGKLFGDFKSVAQNPDNSPAAERLLEDGYVKGKDYYFKPSSIPGFAYAYGVLTNNKIWQDHFPYAKPEVFDTVKEISDRMRGSAGTIFSKAEQYKKIFRELKSFLFTDNLISPTSPASTRKLLLYNYTENNAQHLSLANIMYEVKQNPATAKIFRENMFLSNLYIKTTSDKRMPRIVMFRQPSDDETSNRDIYNEVYNLVKYPVDFGVFNGIKYNSRTFIEHLMLASNVSMTSAMQFNLMQYIPTELMVEAGIADNLHKYDWARLQQNPVGQPYRATVQYFQHYPHLAPEVDLQKQIDPDATIYGHDDITDEEMDKGFTLEDAQQAAIGKPENIKQFTLKPDEKGVPTFWHLKAGKKVMLFMLTDPELHQYSRISTLLNSATSSSHEYNANVGHAVSVLPENNPHALTVPAASIGRQNLPPRSSGNGYQQDYNKDRSDNINKILAAYGARKAEYNLNPGEIDKILDRIFQQSGSPENRLIAAWLRNLVTTDKKTFAEKPFYINMRFEALPNNKKGVARTNPKTGHIQVWINPYMVDSDSGHSDFEHTVLHEMVHAVTKMAILQGAYGAEVIGKIHPSQKRAYKNLKKLYDEYYAKYINNQTAQALLAKLQVENFDPSTLTVAEKQELIDYVYPGKNLEEFLVGIMMRPQLRQRLQNMQYSPASPNYTLWDRIMAIFDYLLDAMGLEVGSTPAKAIKDIMFLSEHGNTAVANADTLQIPIEKYTKVSFPLGTAPEVATEPAVEDVQSAEVASPPEELAANQVLYDKISEDKDQKIEESEKGNPPQSSISPPSLGFIQGAQPMTSDLFNALKKPKTGGAETESSLPNITGGLSQAVEAITIKKPKQKTGRKARIPKISLKTATLLAERDFTIKQLIKHEASLRADLRDPTKVKTREDVKRFQKRIANVRENREAVEANRDKIAKLSATEHIVAVGKADMKDIAEQLLDPGSLDMRDFHILRTRLNLWLNYEENFLDKADQQSPITQALFNDVHGDARANSAKLLSIQQERIYNWAQDYLKRNISAETFYSAMKDIGWAGALTLGLDNADHPLAQAIAQAVLMAEAEQVEEFHGIQEEIKKLFANVANKEHITGKNFNNFFEIDKDGIFTGKLVKPYSAEFVAAKASLRAAITNAATNVKARNKARRALDKFRQENELFFDLRKLVSLEGFEEMHAADAGKLEAELKQVLGEVNYAEKLQEAQEKYQEYVFALENKREDYEAKYPGQAEHIENAMKKWQSFNDIIVYWERMTNPASKTKSEVTVNSWRYAVSVAKAVNTAGQSQYSAQYLKLQSDPDVAALHKYVLDLLKKLRSYIPVNQQREFAANSVPTIEKDFVEMLKTEGLVASTVSLMDKLQMGLTSKEQGGHLYGVDTNNRSLDINVKNLANDIETLYAQKVRDYERSSSETLDEKNPAHQQILLQFRRAASEQVQKESSLDLPHLLALYTQALTVYRHKAKIEDAVRLAEETFIATAKERLENSAGEPLERQMPEGQSQPEYKKVSHPNHVKMLNNHMNHFFGVRKPVELQTEQKLYTKSEKTRLEALRKELTQHQADLARYEKELDDLKTTTEGLSAEQAEKRSKQVTEIDAKRAITAANVEEVTAEIAKLGQYITGTGAANTLIQAMIVKGLGWNVFGGATNLLIGTMSNYVEAAGGRWYNEKEMRQATKIALNSTVRALSGGLYANDTTQKLNLLMSRLDILKSVTKEQFRNDTPTDSMLGNLHWGQVYKTTEYMNQSTVLIAMMLHTKIKDLAGNEATLWEAFGKRGEWDSKRFGELNAADSPFNAKDRALFKTDVDRVVRNNHGNYSKTLEIALKEKSIGKLLAVFRGWMFEGFRVRFEKKSTEFVGDFDRKGRYRSYAGSSLGFGAAGIGTILLPGVGTAAGFLLGSYLGNRFRDDSRFKEGFKNTSAFEELAWTTKYLIKKLSFGAIYSGVTLDERFNETDAINLRRNMAEISFLLYVTAAMMALKFLFKGDDDDDEKRSLMYSLNILHRMQQDIGFYANPVTTMQVLQDPVPALGLIEEVFSFVKASAGVALDPASDEIPTGRHAHESKWYRSFQKLFPGTKAWQSFWNMTETEIKD